MGVVRVGAEESVMHCRRWAVCSSSVLVAFAGAVCFANRLLSCSPLQAVAPPVLTAPAAPCPPAASACRQDVQVCEDLRREHADLCTIRGAAWGDERGFKVQGGGALRGEGHFSQHGSSGICQGEQAKGRVQERVAVFFELWVWYAGQCCGQLHRGRVRGRCWVGVGLRGVSACHGRLRGTRHWIALQAVPVLIPFRTPCTWPLPGH